MFSFLNKSQQKECARYLEREENQTEMDASHESLNLILMFFYISIVLTAKIILNK